ncbi:MAG TPA: 5-amino-6-(D-ribitylamino)uracil--L-tyrosine 4-hydroxyphenyl transferase CofH, partial [Spongiibacteraceae bacterium]|nr:5-amino-6-(D-ribitylamino)uracil--L-tyrosine 4-hydroxyphenyl transferase CofH [Spongiibacteraceae bacterium]
MAEPISAELSNEAGVALIERALRGEALSDAQALQLADCADTPLLMTAAAQIRDRGFRNVVTYSRKIFLPLTQLCRDVCHYCTFAQTPRHLDAPYMAIDDVIAQVRAAEQLGCKEALLTLGEKPELRYRVAREALAEMGFASTLDYVAAVAERIFKETGILPHINAGTMDAAEIAKLRRVSASMGIMLESAATRLCGKGMPHYGSPDKDPAVRLETMRLAGAAAVPFTSGILIGIGETRRERIESLLALRAVNAPHGHLQEIIVQNFRAKPDTLMAQAPEPDLNELLWTIAVARLIFGATMSIQAPPNLSPGVLPQLIAAGINDWGGVSPVTPDFVNPEAPWPHLDNLARETAQTGKLLQERLTIYPAYALAHMRWLDVDLQTAVLQKIDAEGFARADSWSPGEASAPPAFDLELLQQAPKHVGADVRAIVDRARAGQRLSEPEIVRLFQARGDDFSYVCQAADALRRTVNGDGVAYVVNRNINYTNICYFKCQFCAFSKGKLSENLRGRPYDLAPEEIQRRVSEAWQRGATEVCMQGGIHPEYTGQTYLDILATVKAATPDMHIHAFSPLEVWQGAKTLGIELEEFLRRLKEAGLGTLPGTAAEILDDEVRATLCPDKIGTDDWLRVIETAHKVGLRTTSTIMYGHIERHEHWARHILRVRDLQARSGGLTEFVPLPFVAMEAPLYLKGRARRGPTFREAVLMHAVARLALHTMIANIQASWVKMGEVGVAACLAAGANDVGGTLMNESITRAAGAEHGQELPPERMDELIRRCGREPRQRTTLYGEPDS